MHSTECHSTLFCFAKCRSTSDFSICLFIYLSVGEQDVSRSYGWIRKKLGGELGYVTRTTLLNFGEVYNSDLDPIIFVHRAFPIPYPGDA